MLPELLGPLGMAVAVDFEFSSWCSDFYLWAHVSPLHHLGCPPFLGLGEDKGRFR